MEAAAPPVTVAPRTVPATRIALVAAAAHALNDAYSAVVPPLLPRMMDRLGLSIALAATLSVAFAISASALQPLFGYLADHFGWRRLFLVAGPLVSGVFASLIGFAPGFWMLILLLTISGLGSAAFHPPGASYAARVSEGKGSGARLSIFSFSGSVGFAIGPVAAVWLVQARGLEGFWIAMLPVVVATPLIYLGLAGAGAGAKHVLPPPRPSTVVRLLAGPLGLIFGISAVMAFVQRTFLTMEPIIVAEAGGPETAGAVALSLYLGAQAFGTLTGGILADHVDRRRLLATLCLLALPAHLAAVALGPAGPAGLLATIGAGFLGMATVPPIVVMAQELLPGGAAVSSGIVMGLAWATGSLGVLGVGVLADALGAAPATLFVMPIIVLAVALALHPSLRGAAPAHGPA